MSSIAFSVFVIFKDQLFFSKTDSPALVFAGVGGETDTYPKPKVCYLKDTGD